MSGAAAVFNFDSAEPIPAEKPFRDISEFQNTVLSHIMAINASLLGIKAMLFVTSGGAIKLIAKAAWWMFRPFLGIL